MAIFIEFAFPLKTHRIYYKVHVLFFSILFNSQEKVKQIILILNLKIIIATLSIL